jgi:transposase
LFADRNLPPSKQLTYSAIAGVLNTTSEGVGVICHKYVEEGLHWALYDKPRPGATPKITGEVEAKLVPLACSDPPAGRKRWTLRLLAEQMVELGYIDSISNVAVYKRLKNELNPWQVKSWCIPKAGAAFVAKMEDVLHVYARPYNAIMHNNLLCVLMKRQKSCTRPCMKAFPQSQVK